MPVIQQYNYNSLRNFSYLIYCSKSNFTAIIDPFDGKKTAEFIEKNNLQPKFIINTHHHWDHIQGNDFLAEKYNLEVIFQRGFEEAFDGITQSVKPNDILTVGEEVLLEFQSSPGHTESHLAIYLRHKITNKILSIFSGDTLFNAGVGNCRNGGNVDDLYQTIKTIYDDLEDDVILYPGHDYLVNNLNFSNSIQKSPEADLMLEEQNKNTSEFNQVPLTMAVERKVNLFLREKRKELKNQFEFAKNSDQQIFVKLRELRDKW